MSLALYKIIADFKGFFGAVCGVFSKLVHSSAY